MPERLNPGAKCWRCKGAIVVGMEVSTHERGPAHADKKICSAIDSMRRSAELHRMLPLVRGGVLHRMEGACSNCTEDRKPGSIPPFHEGCRCWLSFGKAPDEDLVHELHGKITDLEKEVEAYKGPLQESERIKNLKGIILGREEYAAKLERDLDAMVEEQARFEAANLELELELSETKFALKEDGHSITQKLMTKYLKRAEQADANYLQKAGEFEFERDARIIAVGKAEDLQKRLEVEAETSNRLADTTLKITRKLREAEEEIEERYEQADEWRASSERWERKLREFKACGNNTLEFFEKHATDGGYLTISGERAEALLARMVNSEKMLQEARDENYLHGELDSRVKAHLDRKQTSS